MDIIYWLAKHPAIVGFRWSHAQSWGSTWFFLFSAIAIYVLLAVVLHLSLLLLGRREPVPLGPLPTLHSLLMALLSASIFLGILASSLLEMSETRWFWRRTKTESSLQWLLCFPIGTRPTGRVFFWSYLFYLSRLLHSLRGFFSILRRRRHALSRLFSHSALVVMSFLWLEFSQSFQVVAILSATAAHAVLFGYRFWVGVGLPSGGPRNCFPIVVACQVGLLGCNLVCHLGVLLMHLCRGGCSGIGAWVFNSVLNGALLLLFLNCCVRRALMKRNGLLPDDDDCGSHHCRKSPGSELLKNK
ncbi:putative elongation of fatty acids protein 3-like [Iris pallida]|uniref:Elongation of fatty acids protein 3-like n=1 Tax=Iris pallida TaxID=29817 RepID=A0AAX6I5B1_IRIPA|nr:putative elongation of fatty acids protein 3-like [Iris pallida]